MNDINNLFFELIRVAIGNQICLSRAPKVKEWQKLYAMAKKQSLVGVCFAGVQKLVLQEQVPEEMLYLTWMGMAAKIQQRNEIVNRQCVELQAKFSADGFRSSILKGQGVASLYSEHLCGLRQSGDIDVFVAGGMAKAFDYCKQKYGKFDWDYINAHIPVYEDTDVELHWRVHSHTNLFKNKRLQKWLAEHEDDALGAKVALSNDESITTPSIEFNAFYILLHCYHHMFESGLGLRQLMDYYFVLLSLERECPQINREFDVNTLFAEFGMSKFASGIMWLLEEVFKLERECMICEPNEKEGRFLLNEVMQNGNFGHHDERVKKVGSGKMQFLFGNVQHNFHLATHYPSEFFWAPVWLVYHYFWKRTNINKI